MTLDEFVAALMDCGANGDVDVVIEDRRGALLSLNGELDYNEDFLILVVGTMLY